MNSESVGQTLKIPLDEHEQLLLMRYKQAEEKGKTEKKEPDGKEKKDFIERGLEKEFIYETFLYVYYAGHGCMDHQQ